jgi:Ran GTPase-activating protein (RanGAP) involved in mRNA processing and transport
MRLRELALRGVAADPGALELIAHSRNFADLERLDLAYNPIGREGATHLADSLQLRNLRRLDLDCCALHQRELQLLASTAHMTRLEWLTLESNGLRDPALAALVAWPLGGLQHLNLAENQIGLAGLRAVAGSHTFAGLQSLDLTGCGLGPDELQAFGPAARFHNLSQLRLANNGLDDSAGIERLIGSASLSTLTRLDLNRTGLSDRGLELLAHSPLAENLQALDVGRNRITDDGFEMLLRSPLGERLRFLRAEGNAVGGVTRGHLQDRFRWRVIL